MHIIKLNGRRVLVEMLAMTNIKSSVIAMPASTNNSKEVIVYGVVKMVGPEAFIGEPSNPTYEVKSGDTVMFNKHTGTTIHIEDVEHRILNFEDITATIELKSEN